MSTQKMYVNFLHSFFEAKVDCDVVTSDGYSVTNLVSSDVRENSRGFLASHFIKPPALVVFQLPFAVHVGSIVIKPKVGSQISTGIAILVAEIKANCTLHGEKEFSLKTKLNLRPTNLSKLQWTIEPSTPFSDRNRGTAGEKDVTINPNDHSTEEKSLITHNYALHITPATAKGEHSQFFTQVAWLNNNGGQTVHFKNNQFKEIRPVQSVCIPCAEGSDICKREFQRMRYLQKVTHVALKVVRVSGSSVPAIGKVEIWGQPAVPCLPEVLKYALNIQTKIIQAQHKYGRVFENNEDQVSCTASNVKCLTPTTKQDHAYNSVPEEFIDPITCDIMTIPLLLPSGHNIDSSTLEKHRNAEKSWGRPLSDPFTGIAFSDMYKAIPNSALKCRIDKFLLTSAVNVAGFGRTVGQGKTSHEVANQNRAPPSQTGKVSLVSDKAIDLAATDESNVQRNQQRFSGSNTSEDKEAELDHEEAVSHSLDSAIHQTLQGLHMFTRSQKRHQNNVVPTQSSIVSPCTVGPRERRKRQAPAVTETLKNSIKRQPSVLCVSCQGDLTKEPVFHLPCQHVVCRHCLTVAMQTTGPTACKHCGIPFRQMDVVRVHNV